MLRPLLAAALLGLGAGVALAQNVEVIKERKAALKAMGDAVKPTGAMLKGEEDFDLEKVKTAIKVIKEKTAVLPKLFPEDSKTGGETAALPAIWENKSDLERRYAELSAAATEAEKTIVDDLAFEEVWPDVVSHCGNCHKKYREKKQ